MEKEPKHEWKYAQQNYDDRDPALDRLIVDEIITRLFVETDGMSPHTVLGVMECHIEQRVIFSSEDRVDEGLSPIGLDLYLFRMCEFMIELSKTCGIYPTFDHDEHCVEFFANMLTYEEKLQYYRFLQSDQSVFPRRTRALVPIYAATIEYLQTVPVELRKMFGQRRRTGQFAEAGLQLEQNPDPSAAGKIPWLGKDAQLMYAFEIFHKHGLISKETFDQRVEFIYAHFLSNRNKNFNILSLRKSPNNYKHNKKDNNHMRPVGMNLVERDFESIGDIGEDEMGPV